MSETTEFRPSSLAARYGIAVLACGSAVVVQFVLRPVLGPQFPLALLPLAVVLAAWYGGFGPGMLATVLGMATAHALFSPVPRSTVDPTASALALAIFALAGLLVSASMRHLRDQAQAEREARRQTERVLRHTAHLQQLTAALSRSKTPAEVIRTSVPDFLHTLEGTTGALLLVADDGLSADVAHAIGHGDGPVRTGLRVALAEGAPLTEAIQRHDLVIVDGRTAPRPATDDPLTRLNTSVFVPLVTAGRAIGAIAIGFDHVHGLAGDERQFLLSAARGTAQAYDRARLYDVAERARAEAEAFRSRAAIELREREKAERALRDSETRYRSLAARTARLHELSAGLSEALTMRAVAKVIVRQGRTVVGASAGSVALIVESAAGGSGNDPEQFETIYGEPYPQPIVDGWQRFHADEGLCSTAAIRTRRPVFVASLEEWQTQYPGSATLAADGGFASSATLPMAAEGHLFGVLTFHFTAPVNFDDEYRALLSSVGQLCAQALDRARLYEGAEQARDEAEAANRSKDDFLSTISHELRTPLNAILGWATMLRKGTLDADRNRRAIEAIVSNATRQARLIDDLLDVSRIVAGRTLLDLQELHLGDCIRGAVEAIMPQAEARSIELMLEELPAVDVAADPQRLEQVFLNLLSNAVKFTPERGTILVSGAVTERSVDVRVTDSGDGIDAAFLPRMFERFQQADSTTTRKVGGLGLGLFIARHLVEAHGGTIRAESAGPGLGATFTVTIPIAGTRRAARSPAAQARIEIAEPVLALTGVCVLVVDDEPDAREMMTSALETCGARVVTAASGRAALDTLAHTEVDVVLADIAMPEIDGYELIREIRALPVRRVAAIPAAAVTACAREDERQRALAAGFQVHLAKPFLPPDLAKAVASLVHDVGVRTADDVRKTDGQLPD